MPKFDPAGVLVVHRLGRRVHLRAPALSHHRDACQRIADRLAAEFQGHRVAVRPQTGSVIVEADTGTVDGEALAKRLTALVAEERDEQGRLLLDAVPVERGRPSALARAVMEAFRGVNEDVRVALEGKADLGSLAPIALAASSVFQVIRREEIHPVPWFNLLWFSMRSFLAFNADPHVEEAVPPEGSSQESVVH